MGYQIIATFNEDEYPNAINVLLIHPSIRFLYRDRENERVSVDMLGDFNNQAELTRKFCALLIDAGVTNFDIRHSY